MFKLILIIVNSILLTDSSESNLQSRKEIVEKHTIETRLAQPSTVLFRDCHNFIISTKNDQLPKKV